MERVYRLDIAWIIALWQAIHGGDPPPDPLGHPIQVDRVTQDLLQVLTNHLAETHFSSSKDALNASHVEERLNELGFQVKEGETLMAFTSTEGEPPIQPRPYCFQFQGQTICVYFPRKTVSAE